MTTFPVAQLLYPHDPLGDEEDQGRARELSR